MKLSSKPISSPGRTEKFPPPLMRFLRSNVGSRSRGRSRSSPMFIRKKNTTTTIETQEPSSPKVTCIGQVRVRRSKQTAQPKPGRTTNTTTKRRCWCWWFPIPIPIPKPPFSFCNNLASKLKPISFRPVCRKWVMFFQPGRRRKYEDSSKIESKDRETDPEDENDDVEEEEATRVYVTSYSSTPPKNALLLTRCRSAPYRSSSLASRFWGSPPATQEEGEEEQQQQQRTEQEKQRPTSENEPICRDSSAKYSTEPETKEESLGLCEEFEEGSINGRTTKSPKIEALKTEEGGEGGSVRPLILTRCKSEPARTAEKIGLC